MKSKLPKVLHSIAGRPLVGHVLSTAASLGAEIIEVVLRHERDLIAEALSADYPGITIVDQDDIPGTGRAVQVALDALPADFEGDVLVLSGDVPLLDGDTLQHLIEKHRAASAQATVLTAVLDDPQGYGRVIRDEQGDVARIVEQKEADAAEAAVREVNAGVYVFAVAALRTFLPRVTSANAQGEVYLTDMVGLLTSAHEKVAAEIAADPSVTAGINDRAQLAEAARSFNARIVRKWQREGVTILDPTTTWIDETVTIAPDVTILPNTHLLRATTIAEDAVIGPDTTIVDTEIGAGAVVKRSDVTLAVIGPGATVGPFAYVRPGTVLSDGGKIGTFVETKNANIGAGSKVPHLSYVGDATIGVGVNLGAGAITANYDDIAKHRTMIGDEVHTGSHNVFVAPVSLGAGAKTGAGAVIRKDVPAGALAMSIAPQRNIEGWTVKNRPGTKAAEVAERAARREDAVGTEDADANGIPDAEETR